jgi:hypothetical protein
MDNSIDTNYITIMATGVISAQMGGRVYFASDEIVYSLD